MSHPAEPRGFPPRIWAVHKKTAEFSKVISNFSNWNSHYGTPVEYLSKEESESLIQAAKVEVIENLHLSLGRNFMPNTGAWKKIEIILDAARGTK